MEQKNVSDQSQARLAYLQSKAAALPRTPGVYIMQNRAGKVIYVGKSRSLRDRVSQYFHGSHDRKTEKMASSVHDFRFVTCNTEMEALALENSLIKQHTPKYNIKLKDAKSYPYLKLSLKEQYPRITVTRRRVSDGSLYFGPYSSTQTVYSVLASLERSLGIPTCKMRFPEDIGKGRPCVLHQIGRCMGVCTGKVSQTAYREVMERAAMILRGGTHETIRRLTEKMNQAAESLEFEEAARCRDSIAALRKLGERQKAVGAPDVECDVVGLYLATFENTDVAFHDCVSVFYIRSGYISDTEHFLFGTDEILTPQTDLAPGDEEDSPLSAFLASFYRTREYIPNEILLSFSLSEHESALLSAYISEFAGHKVTVRTPKRGSGRYLCDMAVGDAEKHSENTRKRESNTEKMLANLASLLALEVYPTRIEAYDISNLGSEHITAGMITILDGKFKKSDYRTFKIKDQSGPDDYAAMTEVLSRRLQHIAAGEEGDILAQAPDLIFLDGGKGHVAVIQALLDDMGLQIPVFGMVKDDHHKTRTITTAEDEVNIARHPDVFKFIYGIQEEVHRYTVSQMTHAKGKSMTTSTLESIRGIGPKKAKKLLAHFHSMKALQTASAEELREVDGVSPSDAEQIYQHFRKVESK